MKTRASDKETGHEGKMYARYTRSSRDALERLVSECKLTRKVDKLLQEELVTASWVWMQQAFEPAVLMEFLGPHVERIREELRVAQQKNPAEAGQREPISSPSASSARRVIPEALTPDPKQRAEMIAEAKGRKKA